MKFRQVKVSPLTLRGALWTAAAKLPLLTAGVADPASVRSTHGKFNVWGRAESGSFALFLTRILVLRFCVFPLPLGGEGAGGEGVRST